jgi:hypothetical protein
MSDLVEAAVPAAGTVAPIAAAPIPAPAPSAAVQPLHEYCLHLSTQDKRVEMISAFEFTQRMAGNVSNTVKAYDAAYAAFVNQPVG